MTKRENFIALPIENKPAGPSAHYEIDHYPGVATFLFCVEDGAEGKGQLITQNRTLFECEEYIRTSFRRIGETAVLTSRWEDGVKFIRSQSVELETI